MCVGLVPSLLAEAAIVCRQQTPQHLVGLLLGGRPGQPQLLDPAVLGGAEGPLDASLGLWAVGPDQLDAQLA